MSTKEGLALLARKYNRGNGWKYGGGNFLRIFPGDEDDLHYEYEETYHTRYFLKLCNTWGVDGLEYLRNKKQKNYCVCGHKIKENCFIYKEVINGVKLQILGNCCIKKLQLEGRRCSICNEVHRNTKDNYCKTCRKEWFCKHCGEKKGEKKFRLCYKCNFTNRNNTIRRFNNY